MAMKATPKTRISAEERKEEILRAAIETVRLLSDENRLTPTPDLNDRLAAMEAILAEIQTHLDAEAKENYP